MKHCVSNELLMDTSIYRHQSCKFINQVPVNLFLHLRLSYFCRIPADAGKGVGEGRDDHHCPVHYFIRGLSWQLTMYLVHKLSYSKQNIFGVQTSFLKTRAVWCTVSDHRGRLTQGAGQSKVVRQSQTHRQTNRLALCYRPAVLPDSPF